MSLWDKALYIEIKFVQLGTVAGLISAAALGTWLAATSRSASSVTSTRVDSPSKMEKYLERVERCRKEDGEWDYGNDRCRKFHSERKLDNDGGKVWEAYQRGCTFWDERKNKCGWPANFKE